MCTASENFYNFRLEHFVLSETDQHVIHTGVIARANIRQWLRGLGPRIVQARELAMEMMEGDE